MNVFVVFRKKTYGQYEDISLDVDVVLVTHEPSKVDELLAVAKKLDVQLEVRECNLE